LFLPYFVTSLLRYVVASLLRCLSRASPTKKQASVDYPPRLDNLPPTL